VIVPIQQQVNAWFYCDLTTYRFSKSKAIFIEKLLFLMVFL